MATVGVYSFAAKTASRGCQAYEETSWSKVQDREKDKVELEMSQSSKKKLTHTLLSFVLRRNITKNKK